MKPILLSTLVFLLSICATQAQIPTGRAVAVSPAQLSVAPPVEGAGGAPLRVGDTFELRLNGVPAEDAASFGGPLTVDDQGMINLPYINQVKVAGLLPNQIQEIIQNRLIEEKIFTHPTVTISQNQPRFVNVAGEVKAPQRVPFTPDLTLISALNAAGWFTDFANQNKIHLIRSGKNTIYSYKAIRKDPSLDPKLIPGDSIQVEQSFW